MDRAGGNLGPQEWRATIARTPEISKRQTRDSDTAIASNDPMVETRRRLQGGFGTDDEALQDRLLSQALPGVFDKSEAPTGSAAQPIASPALMRNNAARL